MLGHIDEFLKAVIETSDAAAVLVAETSNNPPVGAHRQTRYANKLDRLKQNADRGLEHYTVAVEAGRDLPPKPKCSASERSAKQILAGIKAIGVPTRFADFTSKLGRLALRARQPMSPEEYSRFLDELRNLSQSLQGLVEIAHSARQLIARCRERDAVLTRRQDVMELMQRATATLSFNSVAIERIVSYFGRCDDTMNKVDQAIALLLTGITNSINRRGDQTIKPKAAAEDSLIEQVDDLRILVKGLEQAEKEFEEQLSKCLDYFDAVNEVESRVTTSDNPGPMAGFVAAVEELRAQLRSRLAIATEWVSLIKKRIAAAYVFPGYVAFMVSTIRHELHTVHEALNRNLRRLSVASGAGEPGGIPPLETVDDGVFAGLTHDQRVVFEAAIDCCDASPEGVTAQDLVSRVGVKYSTILRRLKELGLAKKCLVQKIKRSRQIPAGQRDRQRTSLPDLYLALPSVRARYAEWLSAHRANDDRGDHRSPRHSR